MRNLTIKRTKSFVGCAVKMKVYIEDPNSQEIIIRNIPCRKIGDLKNGEEKTFQITEEAAKVFVIADKLSKDYCNEFYQLSPGQEDVSLSGKNKYNPANGNAFLFDNNTNAEALQNRKKGTKKGIVILCVAAIVGAIVGYVSTTGLLAGGSNDPKTFTANGMSITLTKAFKETQMQGFTNCYDSADVAVFALKEEFTLMEGFEKYTLEQYADLVIQNNNLSEAVVKKENGLTGFQHEWVNPDTQDTCRYISFVYKTEDAFWLVQFATLKENADARMEDITQWAKTVTFD